MSDFYDDGGGDEIVMRPQGGVPMMGTVGADAVLSMTVIFEMIVIKYHM
jgi:predicted TIM-barrel enzyme